MGVKLYPFFFFFLEVGTKFFFKKNVYFSINKSKVSITQELNKNKINGVWYISNLVTFLTIIINIWVLCAPFISH